MGKSNKIRHPKKRAFLAAYARTASVTKAAQEVHIDRSTHYEWKHSDPTYARAYLEAHDLAIETLEGEVVRRGFEGVQKPVFQGGKEVGRIQEYSDTLLMFYLKGARPEKYRERISTEHTLPPGALMPPPRIEVLFVDPPARDDS